MLSKQNALDKIKELEKYVKGMNDEILIPDSIKLTYGMVIGILFNDDKQELYWGGEQNAYAVSVCSTNIIKAKLIPCMRKGLKTGDVAFRTDISNPDFSRRSAYCVIEKDFAWYVSPLNEICNTTSSFWRHWYKVVPCE